MPEDFSDDYVAELLKRDAKAKNQEYSFVGLSAFRAPKPSSNAPKPNTRFLRNIIRDTDSHNAALKQKEEAEAESRFRALRKGNNNAKDERRDRPLKAERKLYEPPSKRRRVEDNAQSNAADYSGSKTDSQERRRRSGLPIDAAGGKERASHRSARHTEHEEPHSTRRHRRHHSLERERTAHSGNEKDHSRERTRENRSRQDHKQRRSRSPGKEASRSPSRDRSHRRSHRRRRSRDRDRATPTSTNEDGDHSDPLEDIVGPLPAREPVKRGRGALQSSAAMDARFDESYDPSSDIRPEASSDKSDWGEAVEAFRDRAKWKALGADRLRSAGFSDAEVGQWEKSGREKDVDDVVWAKTGEGREWDRGKVLDSSGDTTLKANWNTQ